VADLKVISWNSRKEIDETHKDPSEDSKCSDCNPHRTPPCPTGRMEWHRWRPTSRNSFRQARETRYFSTLLANLKGAHMSAICMWLSEFLTCRIFSLWLYSPIQALAASMKFSVSLQLLDLEQLVGLLGRMISPSQGLYLYTNTWRIRWNNFAGNKHRSSKTM
jgi:hypothetical protein